MFSSLFKSSQPAIEPDVRDWIFEVFAWSLREFDPDFFFTHSELVLPNNDFFPGRADSEQAMAELIFNQVSRYAGVTHWPTEVARADLCAVEAQQPITISAPLRLAGATTNEIEASVPRLRIPYNPQQLNNPEALIASFAHVIAHYLGQFASKAPPGDPQQWPHVTEIVAIFLGFGLMFANSAYTFRGGCGSCYNPAANRDAFLTERQSTYALALFARLKGIDPKRVTPHLKSHLRGFYRRAAQQLGEDALIRDLLPGTVPTAG